MEITVSRANRCLVVPPITALDQLFSTAPKLGDRRLIPHGLGEYRILKHLGVEVPHPMLTYYDWCGGKPFDVQRDTCALMTSNPRAYVLNAMGTGKTKSALWAWDYLRENKYAKKALVVATLSNLRFVWAREAFATIPHRQAAVLHGTKARRLELLANPDTELFIINHDGLKTIEKELAAREDIDTLILDELAVYRNNSDRSKAMRKFAQRFQWVWGLTGAPMPNKPTDVWAQAKIITPNTAPKYFNQARDQLMTKVSQYTYVAKPDAVQQAFAMMQPAVRYSLDDVVELPEVISRTIDVDMSEQQRDVYNKVSNLFHAMIEEKKITAVNAAAAMTKLLQISMGWVYSTNPEVVQLENAPRVEALLDLVEANERKVLVFVPYRHAIEGLHKAFVNRGIDHELVHGQISNRDVIFNAFQNTLRYKVLICHPQCVAHGLTLTAADTTIWFGPTPSLEIYEQANARVRRVGQKHKQQVLHLQSTQVEKKIYALLRSKQKIQDQLLTLMEEATERRIT